MGTDWALSIANVLLYVTCLLWAHGRGTGLPGYSLCVTRILGSEEGARRNAGLWALRTDTWLLLELFRRSCNLKENALCPRAQCPPLPLERTR